MQIGIVGLGRMGAGMARRLARAGVHVICYDQADAARGSLAAEPNVACAENLAALCTRLSGERVVILMLPAGGAVEDTLRDLDRKSTRLNSSHGYISYAVFCLKKKKSIN